MTKIFALVALNPLIFTDLDNPLHYGTTTAPLIKISNQLDYIWGKSGQRSNIHPKAALNESCWKENFKKFSIFNSETANLISMKHTWCIYHINNFHLLKTEVVNQKAAGSYQK